MISSSILPDDICAKILSFLPVTSIIRAGSICKHWHEVVHSGMIKMPPQKPWYFMFTYNRNIVGYSYMIQASEHGIMSVAFGRFSSMGLRHPVYESKSCLWAESINETLVGWRGGDESVIWVGILYCLVHSVLGNNDRRHGVIKHNLHSYSSCNSLMGTMIMVSYPLTCGRLINLRGRLVLVGRIRRIEKPDVLKGIGIWELHDEEWEEVARISHKLLTGFGRFDDVFASSGAEDLIFIHSYSSPSLLTFDMIERRWN